MIRSMTGFASGSGALESYSWGWELRSVNGKGLDLRLRVPDWVSGLEVALRKKMSEQIARGNVSCNLKIVREESGGTLSVNQQQLDGILKAMHHVEAMAMDLGVSLAPSCASDIIVMRGVLEQVANDDDTEALSAALISDFEKVLLDFNDMRKSEGSALANVLRGQLDQIGVLASEATELAAQRDEKMASVMQRNIAKVMDNADNVDPQRLAQELALIAIKADITEELDRLNAHIAAARELLDDGGAIGRKLDFLMQEFNREANTLCSKAQSNELTRVGLAMKTVIDQMREQVQNVE